MEALAVVGLSSNILQFVDFSCKMFDRVKQLSDSDVDSTDVRLLETSTKEFQTLYENLTNSRMKVQGHSITTQPPKDPLVQLAQGCEAAAAQLLATFEEVRAKDPNSRRSNIMAAFKITWQERRVNDMQARLQAYRSQLMIHLQVMQSEDWTHIGALVRRVEDQNTEHCAKIMVQFSKLTKEVQHAVNHWTRIESEQSSLTAMPEPHLSPLTLHKEDTLINPPHVASLIWQELSNSPMTIALSILNSLRFHMMQFRHCEIREAHPDTFNWAFENVFQAWLSSSEPVFWISGKPGSGKSTLMKFLVDDPRTLEVLSRWSGPKKLVISSHFFWINGTPLQRSQEGLLRTVLYGILRQCPELAEQVLPEQYNTTKIGITNRRPTELDWPRRALLDAFKRLSVVSHKVETKFCLFLDGLDEYKADAKHSLDDLIKTIQHLAQMDFKICIASRPWNQFEDAFGQAPKCKLYLQELNKPDIQSYVSDHLEARQEFKALRVINNTEAVQILEEVVEKSQGVFLWVYLVVRSLVEGLINHDRLSQLHDRLRRFPNDLDEFFRHIFGTLEPVYQMQAAHMFQVALAAYQPLSPVAYWFMDESEDQPDLVLSMPMKRLTTEELDIRIHQTNARLNGRCKGLLEVTPPVRRADCLYHVDFLHRTVRDFFMANDIHEVFVTEQQPDFNANVAICNATLAELKSYAIFPFAYASIRDPLENFFHAAKSLEADNSMSPTKYLNEVERTMEAHMLRGGGSPWIQEGCNSFLEYAIFQDLRTYMKETTSIFTVQKKLDILHSALKIPSLTQGMFHTLLSNGPAISFDLSLQQALASRLENEEDRVIIMGMIEPILVFFNSTGPSSEHCLLGSDRLLAILIKVFPKKDLDCVRKSVAVHPPLDSSQREQGRPERSVQQRAHQTTPQEIGQHARHGVERPMQQKRQQEMAEQKQPLMQRRSCRPFCCFSRRKGAS